MPRLSTQTTQHINALEKNVENRARNEGPLGVPVVMPE